MYIELACPGCQKRYRADASYAGKSVRCRRCGKLLVVPGEEPELLPQIPEDRTTDDSFAPPAAFDLKDDAPDAGTTHKVVHPVLPPIITEMVLPLLLIVAGVGSCGYVAAMRALGSSNPAIGFVFLGLAAGLLLLLVTPMTIRAIESSAQSLLYRLPNAVWLQAFSALMVPTTGLTLGYFHDGITGLVAGGLVGLGLMGVLFGLNYQINPFKAAATLLFGGLVYVLTSGVVVGIGAVLAVILSVSGMTMPWRQEQDQFASAPTPNVAPVKPAPPTTVVSTETSIAPVAPVTPAPVVEVPAPVPAPVEPQWVSCVDPAPGAIRWPAEIHHQFSVRPPVTIVHSMPPGPFVALLDQGFSTIYDLRTGKRTGFMKQPIRATSGSLSPNGALVAAAVPPSMATGYGAVAVSSTPSIEVWSVATTRLVLRIAPDNGAPMPQLLGFAGNNRLAVCVVRSGGPTLQIWDTDAATVVRDIPLPGPASTWAISPAGRYFAHVLQGKLHVYDLASGELANKTDFVPTTMTVKLVSFAPDGAEIAAVATDMISPPHVIVIDLANGKKTADLVLAGGSRPDLTSERFRWAPGCFAFVVDTDWIDRASGKIMSTMQPAFSATFNGRPRLMMGDYTALYEMTPTGTGEKVIYKSQPLPRADIEAALRAVNGTLPTARATTAPATPQGGEDGALAAVTDAASPDSPSVKAPSSAPAPRATGVLAGRKEWIVKVLAVNRQDPNAIEHQIAQGRQKLQEIETQLTQARSVALEAGRYTDKADVYGNRQRIYSYSEADRAKANIAVSRLEDDRRQQKGAVAKLERAKEAAATSRTITGQMDDGTPVQIAADGTAMVTIAESLSPDTRYTIGGVGRVVDGVLNIKLRTAAPAE